MPARKKSTRGSVRAPSTPGADEDAMVVDTPQSTEPSSSAKPAYDITKDPWTDEQETSLYKGIIRWKPAGMHKHFRMIALSEHLRNHGYDPNIDQHTRIPGIWAKLETLYNLNIIDDRENFEVEDQDKYLDFKLPEEDFDELTFMRGKRSESEAPSSPPSLSRSPSPAITIPKKRKRRDTATTKDTRASTVDDTDEARTSPAASSPPRATRSSRQTKSMGRVKADSSSRQQSKETTADTADEETGAEGTEDGADEEEQDEAEEEEEEGEGEAPSTRPSRGRPKGSANNAAPTRRGRRKR